ncbi:unnamed protein product [Mytilus coruscus]|uniref:Uncharacterized protein n=1 Tax=Mytilus coruscus TaxID=42192 RepID=A0A6J7ZVF1_MYTCO|nr:unnamed protein product [Mytilus coruscus]
MLKCHSKRVSLLPESYSNLPPAVLRFSEPDIPLVEGELSIDMSSFPAALKGEFKWLKHVAENSSVKAQVGTYISWSVYHAASLLDGNRLPAVSALLPLFHEQAKSVTMIRHSLDITESFRNDIVSLYDVIDDLGNPFLETSKDLLVLDSKNIVDISIVKTVYTIESLGQEQFEKYLKERLVDRTTSVFDKLKRNKLPLFQTPPSAKKTSTIDHKLMSLKGNCSLFSRLYIACQSRDGNLDDFFRHENHAFPPSLSQNGTILLGT